MDGRVRVKGKKEVVRYGRRKGLFKIQESEIKSGTKIEKDFWGREKRLRMGRETLFKE